MLTDKGLARKMNLEHLSAAECEKILQVLQKDFELRQKERSRLEKIEEDIKEEENKAEVLAKKTKLNENVCIRCCQTFGFIFNRKQMCNKCHLYVCKSCCTHDMENGGYVCNACVKEKELKLKSCDWFYNNVGKKFKRFGSAKVVRTLYKQRGDCKSRRFHSDNESDSGYDPSLYSSFKSESLQSVVRRRPSLSGVFPGMQREVHDSDEDQGTVLEPVLPPPPQFDSDLFTKPPAPVVTAPIQTTNQKPLQETLNTQNKGDKNRDIYQEAFQSTKDAEEKKFETRFSDLLSELNLSLQNQSPNGVTCNTSYGGVMVTYTNRLRELLVGLSQRLELAIDSFDSVHNQSSEATSEKVRHLVSKLVENSLGESIDLTSDEAVSDLSSLSDEESENHKSFEDQLAQAIVAKVLENHRKETGLQSLRHDNPVDLVEERAHKDSILSSSTIDQGHGDSLQNSDTDQGQSESFHEDEVDNLSPRHSYSVHDVHIGEDVSVHDVHVDKDVSVHNVHVDKDISEEFKVHNKNRRHDRSLKNYESESEDDTKVLGQQSLHSTKDRRKHRRSEVEFSSEEDNQQSDRTVVEEVKQTVCKEGEEEQKVCKEEQIEDKEDVIEEAVHEEVNSTQECLNQLEQSHQEEDDPEQELKKLKSLLSGISQRPSVRQVVLEDEELDVEEPLIEKETVDHEESQLDFITKCSSINYAQEHTASLPDFDVGDFELNSNEIDPDLLSMNLAPILEEDEDNFLEEENEDENEEEEATDWRGNWIFKGNSTFSPYANMGKKQVGSEFGQVYMTIPEPYLDLAPRVGNREADEIFSDLSEKEDDEDNLSDEETSFYSKTSEEIARITRKSSLSQSVHTDDSDLDTSREQWSSDYGVKGKTSKVDKSESSADESFSKKKLIEELVPAEGDDPKFEIPPESLTVPEGEPAKFTCRVGGTDPTDVFWYKVEDELKELEDSEQFELSQEGNRHHMTMYYPVKRDEGQYMAIAINEKGRCCQYLVLKIKKNTQDLKKPEFLKGIQDVEVIEGQSVKFRCKVKGYPQPRVVWYKDGQRLKSQNNCKIEKYGNRDYLLTIDCATMNEDAEYTVVAKNNAGEVKSSAQLIVEPEQPEETFNSTKMSLSLSSFSSSFSDDKRTKNKQEDQKISILGRKMMKTKENVTDVAEDMLSTANELSDLHKSLDQVDVILSTFEKDIYSANTCNHDDNINNNVGDNFLAHNLCNEAVDNYRQLKNAAENVRHVTSSTLNILHTTKDVIDSEKDNDSCLATSTPRQEDSRTVHSETDNRNNNNGEMVHSPETSHDSSVFSRTSYLPSFSDRDTINTQKEESVSKTEIMSVQSEVVLPPSYIDNKPSYDSRFSDIPSVSDSSFSLSEVESEPQHELPQEENKRVKVITVVNMGPKRIDSSQFDRDFFVNTTPKMPRKHWEVNTDYKSTSPPVNRSSSLEDAEEKIYISAAKVYDLEERVDDLTSKVEMTEVHEKQNMSNLEDEVAQTVADIHCSEQEVSSIETSVNQLKLRSPPTVIIGQTSESELPESRTELNEESGIKELPSVNRLKAMFSNSADESSIKRGMTEMSGVHSITARTVPKEKLERFRKKSSNDSDDAAEDNQQRKSQLTVNLAPTPKMTVHEEPTQVFPEAKGETFPPSALTQNAPIKSIGTTQVKVQPKSQSPHASKKQMAPLPPTSRTATGGAVATKPPGDKKSTPKIRSGCIAARASFWEKKIQDPQEASEEEFPEMVVHVQD